jgi:RNA polymerase sigma factor (sigma-70 family)
MATSRNGSEMSTLQDINPDDFHLLARVGLGDECALASLYDRYCTLVYSVALRVCHDAAMAEEVLQNIFMQLWLAPGEFASEPGSLDGRLGMLSRNLAIEMVRRHKSRESRLERSLGRRFDPISHTEVSLLLQKPHALVLLLPDADRQLLEMAFFDGKTSVEIADATGLPVDTIADRLVGALSALRNGAAETAGAQDDTGLEVLDLDTNPEFTSRSLHTRDVRTQMEGLRRLTHSFVQNPDTILQELVTAAVELCGADSAGISLETEEKSDANYYHWVATAGQYNGFLNAVLPRYPSACGICLERGKPQLFRVRQRFFDIMGIEAPLVTDGILLPWQVEETRGTIFIMAHGRTAAFDKDDGQMMRVLADFAAMAVRHQRQQHALLQQAKAAAAAEMANKLAHRINNPLQSLMQVAYLAAEGQGDYNAKTLGQEISVDLRVLSALVTESLTLHTADPSQK